MNAKSNLQLDNQSAIGNLLRAEIIASGDGTPYRPHRYAADIPVWLWPVLLRGRPGCAYNVGSENSLSILALAHRVADVLHAGVKVRTARAVPQDFTPQHYVPQTQRAITELGLGSPLGLDDALRRTARWYGHAAHSDKSES